MNPQTYEVRAMRWEHGWELEVGDLGVTQCATLDQAERQARDFICTMLEVPTFDGQIIVTPQIEGVTALVAQIRDIEATIASSTDALAKTRRTVIEAMKSGGFSQSDIAGALGVSKGRVSQLVN